MTTEAILIHLSPLLFYGLLAGFALSEARSDFDIIRFGGAINHVRTWIARSIGPVVLGFMYIAYAKSFWFALALLGSAAFGFSALFRYRLNKLRGKHPCYVSDSNAYDRVAIHVSYWIWNYPLPSHTDRIHRAGRLAYIVEVVLFTIGAAYVFINMPTL